MLQLTCPVCDTKHAPAEVVFDDEYRVTNTDELDSLAEQAGPDRFRVPEERDAGLFQWLSLADFTRFLTDHTDLLVEHEAEHWRGTQPFQPTL